MQPPLFRPRLSKTQRKHAPPTFLWYARALVEGADSASTAVRLPTARSALEERRESIPVSDPHGSGGWTQLQFLVVR